MPAKAGIQGGHGEIKRVKNWIPVFTGMTTGATIYFGPRFVGSFGLDPTVVRLVRAQI